MIEWFYRRIRDDQTIRLYLNVYDTTRYSYEQLAYYQISCYGLLSIFKES